ncbi:Alpha/Beta hydrolase protein [Dactylonectria estremocensis]|uniref:Alpha/Beta hydrolase protein n=1 Tax=Dactylonectria estremocensis TaxID=1079267 RepID=A0A9P9F804_9HYPO|nr:Alpha/Beta hydrolase protein [Dactylonectria estremocensis]
MTSKQTAPYGSWGSPISVDSVVSKSLKLSSPRTSSKSKRAFYTESREAGGISIIEITQDGLKDVLSAEYSAKNSVYEYGGSPYAVLLDDRIVFSNKDNTVHILDPDTKSVSALTGSPNLRYSDFDAHPAQPWVLANQEDHEQDTPKQIRNYIVAIDIETKEVKRILDSADFYYTPYFSPDGTKLIWLEWNHPDLPFDAAKLYSATWHDNGSISDFRLIAGEDLEGVAEPRWGPDGSLYFGKEPKGYRRLFRIAPGQNIPVEVQLDLSKSEIGEIRWFQGSHTCAPLSGQHLVVCPVTSGISQLAIVDIETGSSTFIGNESILSEIMLDSVARLDDSSFLVIGAGTTNSQTLYRCQIGDDFTIAAIRKSTEEGFPESIYSTPESLVITSEESPGRDIHGFLWLPHNPDFVAPSGELPPLIMIIHGGPTSYTGPGLKLRTQYFTSRGYALLALNHGGSSGHGRKYREALFGTWGQLDSDDAAEFANNLIATKKVRFGRVGITGVSAGGYNTLRTLTRHPKTFAAGVCLSGISDLKRLDESTHKLESDYMDHLILPPGSSKEDKERICRERSPLYHVDKIESPLLLLHGAKDMVTPIDQAQQMADAIKAKGGDVEIIIAPEEGHGFSHPKNVRLWLEEEEKWWRKTLL